MNARAASFTAGLAEGLRGLIRRLDQVLERECADLKAHRLDDLEDYARQKDLLLLDISRLAATAPNEAALAEALGEELRALQETLKRNAEMLSRQLDAAREFAGFVEDTIRRHATDGTYSRKSARPVGDAARHQGDAAARVAKAYGSW